jgi:hypothetical protein
MLLDLDLRLSSDLYASSISGASARKIADLEKELAKAQASQTGVLVVPAEISMEEYIIKAEEQRQKMLLEKEKIARLKGL